jgi:glycine cleavage system H protein
MGKPQDCRFAKTHEWIEPAGDKARVGISDHAQKEITDVVFVELPKVGRKVKAGEACAIVESVKAAFDIYAPVAGEIVAANDAVGGDPAAVNRAPHGDGWLFELKVADQGELAGLMTFDQYEEFLKQATH